MRLCAKRSTDGAQEYNKTREGGGEFSSPPLVISQEMTKEKKELEEAGLKVF